MNHEQMHSNKRAIKRLCTLVEGLMDDSQVFRKEILALKGRVEALEKNQKTDRVENQVYDEPPIC